MTVLAGRVVCTVLGTHEVALVEVRLLVVEEVFKDGEFVLRTDDVIKGTFELKLELDVEETLCDDELLRIGDDVVSTFELELGLDVEETLRDDELLIRAEDDVESTIKLERDELLTEDVVLEPEETW